MVKHIILLVVFRLNGRSTGLAAPDEPSGAQGHDGKFVICSSPEGVHRLYRAIGLSQATVDGASEMRNRISIWSMFSTQQAGLWQSKHQMVSRYVYVRITFGLHYSSSLLPDKWAAD